MSPAIEQLPEDYAAVLQQLKQRAREARVTARRRVNSELVALYWSIGDTILQRQRSQAWDGFAVTRLAEDLRAEFPEMKGFSRSKQTRSESSAASRAFLAHMWRTGAS